MAEKSVHYELNDKTAVIRLDDGKANAISQAVIDSLMGMLDQAEKEATAVLIVGREGRFSGGFDLGVMRSGPENVRSLVKAGAELFLRIFEYPLPVVIACTGHAVAAGAIVLLAADARVGARGEFKIGLSEVAIGMRLPIFAFEFARQRLPNSIVPAPANPLTTIFMTAAVFSNSRALLSPAVNSAVEKIPVAPTINGSPEGFKVCGLPNFSARSALFR